MEEIKFNEFQKEALKEIGNICAGNAATALSQLVGKKIDISVPETYFIPIEEVPKTVGEEKRVIGLVVIGRFSQHNSSYFFSKKCFSFSQFNG
jgi:chemotaxis protein CheC